MQVFVVIANGFEEMEAVISIDILRRAGLDVKIIGLDKITLIGSHNITIQADMILQDCKGEIPDAIVLPGGLPGAENLAMSLELKNLIQNMNDKNKIIAAICASPALVLSNINILSGKKVTCYPGLEKNFLPDVKITKEKVVQDGNIITAEGPFFAFSFVLKIVENLVGKEKANMLKKQMCFKD